MNRDVAPRAKFFRITVGVSDVVWLMHFDRSSPYAAERELIYWRGLFGDLARLETIDAGEDLVVRHMAQAIQHLSVDGSGVRPDALIRLGFAADVVARRFSDALALVVASLPQSEDEPLPANVVRLVPKPVAR